MANKARLSVRRFLTIGLLALIGFLAGDLLAPKGAAATPCNFQKCMYGSGDWWCSWSGSTHCTWWTSGQCGTVSCSGGIAMCGALPCVE